MSSSSSSNNTMRSNDLEALRKYRRSKSDVRNINLYLFTYYNIFFL
jgi:hypothetical protein